MTSDSRGSRVVSVRTFLASYAVKGAFKFFRADGKSPPRRPTVVVQVTVESGQQGWGQAVPSPTWSYETIETVRTTIDGHLAPALLGIDAFDSASIWAVMNRVIAPSFSTGQPIAKAAIDLAIWDLTGRVLEQSLGQRWGLDTDRPVTLSWTVDPGCLEDVAVAVAEAHERGYRHFNVKVGRDPNFDVAVCREIRRLAPAAFVWVDANGGYDVESALDVAPRFADLGIRAFEQPLPANRLPGYRRLVEQGSLPILMDEGVVSLADLESFHQLGLLNGVAVKVSRSGGLTESRRIIDYLRQHGLQFFASGLTDPDLALAACLLLFSGYELPHPAALNGPQFLEGTLLRVPLRLAGDRAYPPQGAGLGVEVDEEQLAAMRP